MRTHTHGFTLVEVVLALAIMAIGVIATAPLFVYAAKENAGGGDLGSVGALAVERLEQLRGRSYYNLENGGDLQSNVDGFSDLSDPDFDVRWIVADSPNPPAGMKVVVVRALANREVIGKAKEVTVATLRSE
jgi:prepilin-type N-terminal cleavage/methylation domain-containing protein